MAIDSVSDSHSTRDATAVGRTADARSVGSDVAGPDLDAELADVEPSSVTAEAQRVVDGLVTDGVDRAGTHTVQAGDTLSHIARDRGVSLSDLVAANPQIADPDRIYPGDEVQIPADAAASTSGVPAEGPVDGLRRGARGPEVAGLQRRLSDLGYATGPIDGLYGPLTQGAVRRFQMSNDLPTTGRVDAGTQARLTGPEARGPQPLTGEVPHLTTYAPGSPEQVRLFQEAARAIGAPESWASSRGLVNLLQAESGGRVGVPNYTYGARARDPSQWGQVHDELKAGRITARSSATGLGQLLLSNVERHYPSGRAGIGDPLEEAAGMLSYIRERYGSPDAAWARYNTRHEGY